MLSFWSKLEVSKKYKNMTVVQVNDTNFEAEVLKADLPVLVDFFAVWCGPCRMAAPIIEEMSQVYDKKVKVVKVDVDQSPQTAGKFGIMSIPTVVMFKAGEEINRQVGFAGKEGYENMIKKALV